MADDIFKDADDKWAQGADDGWVLVHETYTGAGVITPTGEPDRLLELMRTKTGDI